MDGLQPITILVTELTSQGLPEYDPFRHCPSSQSDSFDYNKSDKPQTDCVTVILTSARLYPVILFSLILYFAILTLWVFWTLRFYRILINVKRTTLSSEGKNQYHHPAIKILQRLTMHWRQSVSQVVKWTPGCCYSHKLSRGHKSWLSVLHAWAWSLTGEASEMW